MSKPIALTEADLAEIEMRLAKGWVIRRDQVESLIAMARERNVLQANPMFTVGAVGPQYIPTTMFPVDNKDTP